ncbi:GxxExxY protein [Gemmatimonas sp.]|uniref:GxxExxY protein n=1 Tax=Gemmatimonas sp. TaxID=1962908 RepID=UPI0033404C0A
MHGDTELTRIVIGEAIRLHKALGPGLFESAYEEVLFRRLVQHDLRVERQVLVPFEYDGQTIRFGFRLDLLVERKLIIELKSVERPAPVHQRQLLTYLRLMNLPLGLLINFGLDTLAAGIDRVVNFSCPSDST